MWIVEILVQSYFKNGYCSRTWTSESWLLTA